MDFFKVDFSMIRNWKTYFFSILAACNLVALPTIPSAATTVVVSGNAFITSNVSKDIFRTRAIENALQKIVLEADQDLSSFSIVENGKVLLDQIQSNSEIQILQYEIIEENIKNKKYQVTVRALINNDKSANSANQICKKVKAETIDFSLNMIANSIQFPAWANISPDWLLDELQDYSFNPEFVYSKTSQVDKKQSELYNLFDQSKLPEKSKNIYHLNTKVIFERENKNNLIEKNLVLLAKMRISLFRDNKVISELEFHQPYIIHQTIMNNLFIGANRSQWGKIKNHFSALLKTKLTSQLAQLNCLKITPRLFAKSGTPFIDHGRLDGIEKTDMFVVKSNNTQKTYLKIIEIKDQETELEIISEKQNIESISGKFVELVTGS